MEAVTQDDLEARFTSLAREVGEPLRRYVARRTDPDTAQDVLSEVFLVLWRRLEDVPDDPLPWCYGVARGCLANSARSHVRQRRLRRRIGERERAEPAPDVLAGLPDPEIHSALAMLSKDDQELLRLWAWEDLAPREIAVVLGVTPNAVSIRLHRARRRLAELLGKDQGHSGQEQVRERGPR